MPQAQDTAGNIWEVDEQGNPVRLIKPANAGRVFTLPQSPEKQAQEARAQEAERRAEEDQRIQREAAARAAAKDAREATQDAQGKEYQAKSSSFYGRMLQSQNDWNAAKGDAVPPRGVLRQNIHEQYPNVENNLNDPSRQVTDQAARNFIAAQLRLESGAAISPQEYENQYRIFFPMPGDGPDVIAQKARARQQATEAMKLSAGPLAEQVAATVQPSVAPASAAEGPAWTPEGGLQVHVTDDSPSLPQPNAPADQTPGNYSGSYLGQGMSGVNEGIANTLGLPVDLATEVMNLVPRGLNAAANTNIPEIRNPFLGSDYIKNLMDGWAIRAGTNDPNKDFVRRVGQSVGAAAVPLAGSATSLPRFFGGLVSAAGGGVGGATAQRVFPNNPLAEFVGETIGSGVPGVGLAAVARGNAQRQIENAIPTIDELKQQAGDLYRQAEARGITADPTQTTDLADQLRAILRDEGQISPTGRMAGVYPKVEATTKLADDYAGMPMSPTQMQTVRKVATDGLGSTDNNERRLSRMLTDAFDQWSEPLAPELPEARDISSRYLNAQRLERARELAKASGSQFSASGLENAIRTQYRQLDKEAVRAPGKYGEALQSAIEDVNRGTPASNFARNLGKLAPTGVMSTGLGTVLPAMAVGQSVGPVAGGLTGLAAATAGHLGRRAATNMGLRAADVAELVARNGGAIQQAPLLDPETQRAVAAILAAQTGTYLQGQ